MRSVSRVGQATPPESEWSRVKAIGPEMRPLATASLTSSPSRRRSPAPSQPMRAGRPVNCTASRAAAIQCVIGSPAKCSRMMSSIA